MFLSTSTEDFEDQLIITTTQWFLKEQCCAPPSDSRRSYAHQLCEHRSNADSRAPRALAFMVPRIMLSTVKGKLFKTMLLLPVVRINLKPKVLLNLMWRVKIFGASSQFSKNQDWEMQMLKWIEGNWPSQCHNTLLDHCRRQCLQAVEWALGSLGTHGTIGGETWIPLPEYSNQELLLGRWW